MRKQELVGVVTLPARSGVKRVNPGVRGWISGCSVFGARTIKQADPVSTSQGTTQGKCMPYTLVDGYRKKIKKYGIIRDS